MEHDVTDEGRWWRERAQHRGGDVAPMSARLVAQHGEGVDATKMKELAVVVADALTESMARADAIVAR